MQERVLIYSNESTGPKSTKDLVELFTAYGIYNSVDVACSDFNQNFDGLKPTRTTIVIPGGMVMWMGRYISVNRSKIANLFDGGCNGVFVCAGAYLATHNADCFFDNFQVDATRQFFPSSYEFSTTARNSALNVVSDYNAFGSFIPNDSYMFCDEEILKKIRKPHCVQLNFHKENVISSQMFAHGCGFEPIKADPSCEVVATYADRQRYTFFYDESKQKTIENMPAIIRRKASTKVGGIFLSGPHIETCVENSALLKLFQDGDDKTAPLQQNDYQQESARELVVPLLRETLQRPK